jgi:hypothetical protein
MAEQNKSAFFDQATVDQWDARETGQAARAVLAKIGRMNRTNGNTEQIRTALEGDPDAINGLEHLRELLRAPTR